MSNRKNESTKLFSYALGFAVLATCAVMMSSNDAPVSSVVASEVSSTISSTAVAYVPSQYVNRATEIAPQYAQF